MIQYFFKTGFRNFRKFTANSLLNIGGLALGMSCTILLLLWIYDELSYDTCFKNATSLYRLIEKQKLQGGEVSMLAIAPGPLASSLKEEYPEIIRTTRLTPSPLTLKKGEEFVEETVTSVDRDFLKMFSIEFIEGDINTALNDPHNIIFTEEMAHKYFGNEDALGKTLQSRGYSVTITGVVKSLPKNCHIGFNFLVPIEWLKEVGAPINEWWARDRIYIELKNGTDNEAVGRKIINFIGKRTKDSNSELFLQNILNIHLYSARKYIFDVTGNGDITNVRIMGIIALLILVIASINFMNLSTAQSAGRSKEIAMCKIAGSDRRSIILQFLGESVIFVFIAHIIAMIIVELALPGFNNLTGKQLLVNYKSIVLYAGLSGMILFCGLLAGSYPALYLSSLKPLDALRSDFNISPGSIKFRKGLVIFQFSLSSILILSTLIIGLQLKYIQSKDLGYSRHNIAYFMFPTRPGDQRLKSLKKDLSNIPDIESITISRPDILNNEGTSGGYGWPGKKQDERVVFHIISCDEDYAKTFKLEVRQGRFFSDQFTTDSKGAVINETAVKVMGLADPVGMKLTTPTGSELTIIGVIKDFHFQSLHYKIEPLIMLIGDDNNLIFRIKQGRLSSIDEPVRRSFTSFNPGLPLNMHYLDDEFNSQYRTEQGIGRIVGYFTLLAIIISCLGLLGLSSYLTDRRTKEIGIRKSNGAQTHEIFSMFSFEYFRLIVIALFIACPVAWFVMHAWLKNYAYRITLNIWLFIVTAVFVLMITFMMVGIHSGRTARKNPVDALRYE